ncbi:MAG: SH3 domain-containing protein [Cyanobacteria bacterium P01_A01_bin.105]
MTLNRRFSFLFCLTVALTVALPVRVTPAAPLKPSLTRTLASQLAQVPALPALPAEAPDPIEPIQAGITELALTPEWDGIGYLQPINPTAQQASWLRDITLPLYASAGGEHWGWLLRGWLIPNGYSALAIGRDAGFTMVRTAPDRLAFPILEQRNDGWLRVQYTDGGSAWVHADHLDSRGIALAATFVTPEETARQDTMAEALVQADRLAFQQAVASQVLRSQPELNRNVISLVNADSLIEPLTIQGDWVQVRVISPATGCIPLSRAESKEGWMRWRGPDGDVLLTEGESCS